MTREEALAFAIDALDYVLDYDYEYLSPETYDKWHQAWLVLIGEDAGS